ncbi:MAG: hypothetical protein RI575_17135 [Balneolaceae bacterium]|nr:hypothetical protein [Balneolaceae bacterium]MDR9410659.1 hypothetical protein [Balneolaceae bacterium]
MSTGQVFLTLASLVLLGIISFNIQRMYVSSVESTVEMQMVSDAVDFGRDLSEEVQYYGYHYGQLESEFGGLDDVTSPSSRRSDTSQVGQIFHATVELSGEIELAHGQNGRWATITVYEEVGSSYEMKAEFVTAVANLN